MENGRRRQDCAKGEFCNPESPIDHELTKLEKSLKNKVSLNNYYPRTVTNNAALLLNISTGFCFPVCPKMLSFTEMVSGLKNVYKRQKRKTYT